MEAKAQDFSEASLWGEMALGDGDGCLRPKPCLPFWVLLNV